jgi:two-component system nitrate/nitrite sensor histidine kinase NarX
MILERTRLAREIHDGLAQTLGFMKLQAAQVRNALAREDYARVKELLDAYYATLSDAYQEARLAIDGLRISTSNAALSNWLPVIAGEFQEISGLCIRVNPVDLHSELPPEVHAQLIRIVQEALSNIRKHAKANQVTINCQELENELVMEIHDDGCGFSPEDVTSPSRHGLQGMRERAELIGAEFQIISQPQQGTTVRVRLPMSKKVIGVMT